MQLHLILFLSLLMPIALVVTIMTSTIRIGKEKGIVAKVKSRSSHEEPVPTVGGIPIIVGILFTVFLMTPIDVWNTMHYILSGLLVCFIVGFRDDIADLKPSVKLFGQALAIGAVVTKGGVNLESMYGLFGLETGFPQLVSIVISGFTLLVISNAFNLIDGINGLAGTIGTIIAGTFGIWFYMVEDIQYSILGMAVAGSLLGFLMFNMSPAKTFMGDSGSLVIGLALGVMSIEFIDTAAAVTIPMKYRFNNPIAVCVGIMIIPLFDTIRVFTTRMLRGDSPFQPDRRHIHHLVVDSGFSHLEGTTIIGLFNLLMISLVFYLDSLLGLHQMIFVILAIALVTTYFLHRAVVRINARRLKEINLETDA